MITALLKQSPDETVEKDHAMVSIWVGIYKGDANYMMKDFVDFACTGDAITGVSDADPQDDRCNAVFTAPVSICHAALAAFINPPNLFRH